MKHMLKIITVLIFLSLAFSTVLGSIALKQGSADNSTYMSSSFFKVEPYPQHPSYDSITICWETTEKSKTNIVYYGLTPNCEHSETENNLFKKSFHTVKITDLTPSTQYFYKVVSDSYESNVYCFYTLFNTNDSIRCIAYGDNRGEWDNWQNASKVAEAIEKQHAHFVLNTGDLVHNGNREEEWFHFFNASSFIHNSTLFPVLGNHELYGDYYFKYFSTPNNNRWYSFTSGPIHCIGLDSNYRNVLRPAQLLWLIKDLRSNDAPFTIVFFHHPLYSSGNHGSVIYLRFLWGIFFQRHMVDIVINGHDHSYERGLVGDVNYVVTGGGGGPLYDVGTSWWTIHAEKTYHYCLIEANESALSFQAIKPDGTVFDSFQILN